MDTIYINFAILLSVSEVNKTIRKIGVDMEMKVVQLYCLEMFSDQLSNICDNKKKYRKYIIPFTEFQITLHREMNNTVIQG